MTVVWTYIVALLSFLALDAIALKLFMFPLFSRHIGSLLREQPQMGVALGFYAFFVAGLLYFAVWPAMQEQSLWRAIRNGAILGFLAYGTYEASNLSTLRDWHWTMLVADVSWGTILSATVAGIGYFMARAVS